MVIRNASADHILNEVSAVQIGRRCNNCSKDTDTKIPVEMWAPCGVKKNKKHEIVVHVCNECVVRLGRCQGNAPPPTDFCSPFEQFCFLRNENASFDNWVPDGKSCKKCGGTEQKRMAKFLRCSRCRETIYCGKKCQTDDWASHKAQCKDVEAIKRATAQI